jgi:GT2 family glycosyltransferase
VIVLNYNGRVFLGPCLAALREQTFRDFEVTVVDNASNDDSVSYVRQEFPEVRVIALSTNAGFCVGNNRGIESTSAPYVALLNNDTEVCRDWLRSLVHELDADPDVGFCASLMVRHANPAVVDTAGDLFFRALGVGAKRGSGRPAALYRDAVEVFGACAGAALYRRAMLDVVGLLDEDLGSMDEDIDLSFRAQLRGYRCRYVPDAVVRHHVGASFKKLGSTSVRLARRNMLEVLIKNMPGALLVRHAPTFIPYYIAGDVRAILGGHGRAIVRARIENLRRLGRTLQKRRAIQRTATVDVKELEARMSGRCWFAGAWGRYTRSGAA